MKKVLLSVATAAMTLASVNAQATSGTVKFEGEIVKASCQVTSATKDQTVSIGKYATTAFPKRGAVSASKAFTIALEKCDAGDYSLRFDGPTVANNSNLLAVSVAKGVGIEILDNNEKVIPINQGADDTTTPWANLPATTAAGTGTITYNLKARYKSYDDNVTVGKADASSTFTIEYK